jgi:hypothetical protein
MTLWPFIVLVCLPAAALVAGWIMYGEHGSGHDSRPHTTRI